GADPGRRLHALFQSAAACPDPDGDRGRRGHDGPRPGAGRAHQRGLRNHRGGRNRPPGRRLMLAHLPIIQVVMPLLAAPLCVVAGRGRIAWLLATAVAWASAVIAAILLYQVLTGGEIAYEIGGWAPPWGIEYRI